MNFPVELRFLLKGLLLGVSIAAPVGPIGLLCIRRTLSQGQRVGLASGLGAATADGLYGLIAAFGLTVIAQILVEQRPYLQLLGGLFLCYLGLTTLRAKPATAAASPSVTAQGLTGAYFSTLGLTLTNPATILSFIAIFAGLGIAGPNQGRIEASVMVIGVFLGSALWWFALSWSVNLFRTALNPQRLGWLNKLAGGAIFAFGVVALGMR